jgi:ribosomal protein S20
MYKHDDSVNFIIRQSNNNEVLNQEEKAKFNTIIKKTALGLLKNNNSNSKIRQAATYEVLDYLAKTVDGRSFTLLVKYV